MDAEFCIVALEEALTRFGRPKIFNTDQGSQFTSPRFTGVLEAAGVRISMDGRGRWMDNIFIGWPVRSAGLRRHPKCGPCRPALTEGGRGRLMQGDVTVSITKR
jgi:transposase InsO family protein